LALDQELRVTPLQYIIQRGDQSDQITYDTLKDGDGFKVTATLTNEYKTSVHSSVKYDLTGKISTETKLTRKTVSSILRGINNAVFAQFKTNPEDFISKAITLINEQKATIVIEHLAYDALSESYSSDIFTERKSYDLTRGVANLKKHIYDFVFTDSTVEKEFVQQLDTSVEVEVYAKLPGGFFIPTPVGDYNPDWAIAFKDGSVKHVYFIAETKGSMSSMKLRKIEHSKIECARKFYSKMTSDKVKYDVVNSYGKLMELVK